MAEPATVGVTPPAGATERPVMHITVMVCVGPRQVLEHALQLPHGASVQDALRDAASRGWLPRPEDVQAGGQAGPTVQELPAVGVWGRTVDMATLLKNDDRLEVYRPLQVDPKVARRERFARQGARSAGLFARQRPGGKAGY
jgi:uncharacterized protein